MKQSPIKIAARAIFMVTCFTAIGQTMADTVTLSNTNGTSTFDVPTNVVAKVVHAYSAYFDAKVNVTINGATVSYLPFSAANSPSNGTYPTLPTVVGPATISLSNTGSGSLAFCTIETSPATLPTGGLTPSTAVVIPGDSGGPVTIILETSSDMINWTQALPGTYGTTTTNRFFRVRAQR